MRAATERTLVLVPRSRARDVGQRRRHEPNLEITVRYGRVVVVHLGHTGADLCKNVEDLALCKVLWQVPVHHVDESAA